MRYCFIFLMMLGLSTRAQLKYDVALIPKDLMPYAGAVVRNNEVSVELKNLDYYTYHVKTAITVFNSSGNDAAEIVLWYDKLRVIKYIKGIVCDASGVPVAKITEKNFEDVYANDGFSLFVDDRVKYFRPSPTSYPYTVEYEYELRSKQTLSFYDWMPAHEMGVAIEKSSFVFNCVPDYKFRYKEFNLPTKAVTGTNADGLKTYTWQVNNLKAVKYEPYSPPDETFLPMLKIAPVEFKYGVFTGSFSNWEELGKWNYDKLLTGRDKLLPETVARIKALVVGIDDPKQRARKVYEYMQQKTRYISVQVGVGGFQPYPATDVDKFSYGDCKALVNYTQALLKAADVESYYCVVNAGSEKTNMDATFASMNQGNHIILCLPLKNDTTFLECTNQQIPFGFLSDFTDDRTVLACTPQGGKLMHTPKYTAQQNIQTRTATLNIDSAGMLMGSMKTVYKGTQYDNVESLINEAPAERLKKYKKTYPINNLEIEKLKFDQEKAIMPVTNENLNFEARDYASVTDNKMYFNPNVANARDKPLREVSNRRNNVYINRGYTDDDEIVYTLPAGYKMEKQPLDVSLNKPFGKFTATVNIKDNVLTYKRHIQVIDGTYDKETYAEMVNFFQSVVSADQYTVIISKAK